jgi:hypothetical protein
MKNIDYYILNYYDYEGIRISRVADDDYLLQSEFDGELMVKLTDYRRLLNQYNELKFRMDGLEK